MSEHPIGTSRRRGRPLLSDDRSVRRVQVYMTTKQRADLLTVAATEGKRLSTLVREAVDEYVSDFQERRIFRK